MWMKVITYIWEQRIWFCLEMVKGMMRRFLVCLTKKYELGLGIKFQK